MSNRMISDDLVAWFNERWFDDMGAIDGKDVAFLSQMIATAKPRVVVEIGCASGMSTCILAALMSEQGGGALHSFDVAQRYYVDTTKPVGYLVAEAPPHLGVEITVHRGKTCIDVGDHVTGQIDLCFIDAAHRHPWPLIDTLGVLPLMKPGGIIVHHDLKMFQSTQIDAYATGPKHVLDQAPPVTRVYPDAEAQAEGGRLMKSRKINQNIFALRVPDNKAAFGAKLADGFYLGWDKQSYRLVPLDFADRFRDFLTKNHTPWVVASFAEGMRRYSPPEPATPVAAPLRRPGLGRRLVNRLTGR